MSYKTAFKKSAARNLKKIDRVKADRILRKIEDALPMKAVTFPVVTGKVSGLRKFQVGDYRVIYSIIASIHFHLIRHAGLFLPGKWLGQGIDLLWLHVRYQAPSHFLWRF